MSFDGIVIGSGHNGLVLAAYLARAGLRVAVVERNAELGGACATHEMIRPGFRHNMHANFHVGFYRTPPYRDLELHRYGLAYIFPEVQHGMAFRDGTAFTIHRDVEATARSISRLSEKDARAYRDVVGRFGGLADSAFQLRYGPPRMPFEMAQVFPPEVIPDLARYFAMSIYQAVDSHFEDERVRSFFKCMFHANLIDDQPGSGLYFPMLFSMLSDVGLPVGGTVNMARALARLVRAHGGEVITAAQVKRIVVRGGEATGIELGDGRVLEASRFVASAIDAPQTIHLAGEEHFSSDIVDKMKRWKFAAHTVSVLHLALEQPPRYRAAEFDPALDQCFDVLLGPDNSDQVRSCISDVTAGRIPSVLMGNGSSNTLHDPTYAPAGKHLAWWGVISPPSAVDGPGIWADVSEAELSARILGAWREFAPNLTDDHILGKYLYTPPAMASELLNMVQGGHHMGAYQMDQVGHQRPHPELSGYRTPVKRLYLCGSSSHPGGAITGAPAYNAAAVIAGDLEVPRWWPKHPGMA